MLAKANFNNTDTYISKIRDFTQYYLNKYDARIFKYDSEEMSVSEAYKQYQQFLAIKDQIAAIEAAEEAEANK